MSMKSPCEKVESNRVMLDQVGVHLSEFDWKEMMIIYHQEAVELGVPCPCGMKVPELKKQDT